MDEPVQFFNQRYEMMHIFKFDWYKKLLLLFEKCMGHKDPVLGMVKPTSTVPRFILQRDTPKLHMKHTLRIDIPDDIPSEWTFPSPRNAQKQRIFVGANANDTSIGVLPYITKMGPHPNTPERWHVIRTPLKSS